MHFKEPIIHLFQFMRQKISEFGVDGSSKTRIIRARYTQLIQFTRGSIAYMPILWISP